MKGCSGAGSEAGPLTSESCGNRVTNAMKSSQPALRLMGLGERWLRTLAPSLSAFTSSNMVPAGKKGHLGTGLAFDGENTIGPLDKLGEGQDCSEGGRQLHG